jgi:RNA polymerase sigma factor (sigma-70 family)
MSETSLIALRQIFLDRYDDLKRRLARRLGSADLAGEALQDTWLRLAHIEAVDAVRSPKSYLFRIAFNMARDRQRSEKQHPSFEDFGSVLHIVDETPNPAEIAEARSDLRALQMVLTELPPRRRAILLAARVDNLPRQEIAERLGVSLRLVSKELRIAHEYCVARCAQIKDAVPVRVEPVENVIRIECGVRQLEEGRPAASKGSKRG